MVFRPEMDHTFRIIIVAVIAVIGAVLFLPLLIDPNIERAAVVALSAIFVVTVAFLLWFALSIRYVLHEDHLLVKGGIFRSRIRYEEITKVAKASEIYSGYRMLTAKDAIEIFYRSAVFGSVKVSPRNPEMFVSELKKRCPHADVQI